MNGSRRGFITTSVGGSVALAGATVATANETVQAGKVDRRPFGRTGAQVSIFGLGLGSAFSKPLKDKPEEAQRLVMRALELGINYWDTARNYGDSEELIGPVVEKRRDEIYLVSKSADRTYDGFMRDLETGLKNLKTDHIDLYHIHNLNPDKGDDIASIEKGAAKAAIKAKEQGMIKNFGVTGHSGAKILIEAINAFDPDALLSTFPANRPDSGRYEDELLPLAAKNNMGIVAMKTVRHVRNSDQPPSELIRYALSLPGIATAIVGTGEIDHLESNAKLATNFKPMEKNQLSAFSKKVAVNIPSGLPQPWDLPEYDDVVV